MSFAPCVPMSSHLDWQLSVLRLGMNQRTDQVWQTLARHETLQPARVRCQAWSGPDYHGSQTRTGDES